MRAELYAFRGLMIFLESTWLIPTHPIVYATDSSEAGWAFTQSSWDEECVISACRTKERSRFTKVFGRQARLSALISAGLGDYLPEKNASEDLDQDFAEILANLLVPSRWTGADRHPDSFRAHCAA